MNSSPQNEPALFMANTMRKAAKWYEDLSPEEKAAFNQEMKDLAESAREKTRQTIAEMDAAMHKVAESTEKAEKATKSFGEAFESLAFWWYTHKPLWFVRFKRWWGEQISSRFFPRNKWATKVIGRKWHDKPELARDFLFALVVDFVEGEDCFNTVGWGWNPKHAEIAKRLREVYNWIKTERSAAETRADSLWYPGDINDSCDSGDIMKPGTERGDFAAYCAARDEIERKDTECLVWVVSCRAYLWT